MRTRRVSVRMPVRCSFYAGQGGMTMSIWRALSPGAVIPHCAHNPVAAVAYAAHNPAPPPVTAKAASISVASLLSAHGRSIDRAPDLIVLVGT
jgi:hypothetical protein